MTWVNFYFIYLFNFNYFYILSQPVKILYVYIVTDLKLQYTMSNKKVGLLNFKFKSLVISSRLNNSIEF